MDWLDAIHEAKKHDQEEIVSDQKTRVIPGFSFFDLWVFPKNYQDDKKEEEENEKNFSKIIYRNSAHC